MTSTISSPLSTVLQLAKRERLALETRKSALEWLTRNGVLPPQLTGLQHGNLHPKLSNSLFLTAPENSLATASSSQESLRRSSPVLTPELYSMTSPSETSFKEANVRCSPTSNSTCVSGLPSSCPTLSLPVPPESLLAKRSNLAQAALKSTSVTDLMESTVAPPLTPIVDTATSARNAKRRGTEGSNAPPANKPYGDVLGARPRYLRYNLWSSNTPFHPTVADWSETAVLLPPPPLSELNDPVVRRTVAENRHLFQIVTPINVDVFESLLSGHPNPPFVASVCAGLRQGFWPWANTQREGYPSIYDGARPTPLDEKKAVFMRKQRDVEIEKGRFSTSFGTELLPGMYCMPAHAVPKPNSTDLRMVTDHSSGSFSLNSMVDHDLVTGYPLDNMTHLGEMLIAHHFSNVYHRKTVVWKSDIAEAYRLMPLHPHWQIKQINTVDGLRYVDRNNPFGNSSSAAIFISFNSLVAWIARHRRGIMNLATYIDDSSGFDYEDDLLRYEPYAASFPCHQTMLLQLWDELGIPHKPKKQIFGLIVPVIGIDVDPNEMTLTLSAERRRDLCDALYAWAIKPVGRKANYQLKHWQQMGGWINWAFNVFPLLRPCLNNFYKKISGVHNPTRRIWVNHHVRDDLSWAARHIESATGIRMLRALDWDPVSADFIAYCDACPEGLGYCFPSAALGFCAPTPEDPPTSSIFYFEALCVLCALQDISTRVEPYSRVAIYTDNQNTVQIFSSLACLPAYNHILRRSADILIANNLDLRVLHVPGDLNTVADALSRCQFGQALDVVPNLQISPFQPPRWMLGATKK